MEGIDRTGWGEIRFRKDLDPTDVVKVFSILSEHNDIYKGDGPLFDVLSSTGDRTNLLAVYIRPKKLI